MSQNQKLMLQALNGIVQERPPFWLMRQAGRYLPEYRKIREGAKNFLEFCYTPDLAVEVTLQPLRRFNMDAAILFSDILVIPDALGQKVEFLEGEGPVLDPIRSKEEIGKLSKERTRDHLAPVFEAISRLAREIPQETALIGFSGAPWTVAVYMVEGRGGTECERIRALADEQPDDFQVLVDLLVETTAEYLALQVESGAEIIQIFDSWAGILNEEQFRKWVIQPTRRIVEYLNENCPGVPVIGFPRNSGELAEEYVTHTGVNGVSLDQETPLDWIAKTLQPKCTVQGNLDNQTLVAGGEALDRETLKILGALSPGPFIFNLGHGILPETPPEHVARVAELVRDWPGSAAKVD
jgi:uroporphyrinogen decarboxylase